MSAGRLLGKVALCTGAGRRAGLGAAILQALALEGCSVVFTDLLESAGELAAGNIGTRAEIDTLVQEIRAAGGQAMALPLDVRD